MNLRQELTLYATIAAACAAFVYSAPSESQQRHNVWGGDALHWKLPPTESRQTISWSLHGPDNEFRDLNLLWDGTLDVPGALQLDHQDVKGFGAWRWHWTTTDTGTPRLRGYPTAWPDGVEVEIEVAPGVRFLFTEKGLILPSGAVLY